MYSMFMITFREGLEAFLIVAISAAFLRQTGRGQLLLAVRSGVVAAVLLSAVLGGVLMRSGGMTPLWEGMLAFVASILVVTCTVHMLRHGKNMKREITARLERASSDVGFGASVAIFMFVLLMVGREGVETATMIASLATQNNMQPMLAGGALGVVGAALLALAWMRYGRKVNLSRFFQVSAIFMVLFSVQLVIYAVYEFTEVNALPFLDNPYWHAATEPYGPDGEIGHWLSYGLVLVPVVFLMMTWLRDRRFDLANSLRT